MRPAPIDQPGWDGWCFDGDYLCDPEGNRYHPLFIKACYFYRQLRAVGDLVYWRPKDSISDDSHMQAPRNEDTCSVPDIDVLMDGEGNGGVQAFTRTPAPRLEQLLPLVLTRGHNWTETDQFSDGRRQPRVACNSSPIDED